MKRLRCVVRGDVQGVGFRAQARREGRALGLRGWVRNLADGTVEVWAEGDEPSLLKLLAWARRGPPAARVEALESEWGAPEGRYREFEIAW